MRVRLFSCALRLIHCDNVSIVVQFFVFGTWKWVGTLHRRFDRLAKRGAAITRQGETPDATRWANAEANGGRHAEAFAGFVPVASY